MLRFANVNSAKFVQVRKFYFAELVANADVEACKAGHGPYVLTLATARHFYTLASGKARRFVGAV